MADPDANKPDPNNIEPPKAYLRRIESLENPSRPPITLYHRNRMERLKRGLSEADREIAERLEKLKEDRKANVLPTDDEIKERLAKLRGEPMTSNTNVKEVLFKTDSRTDQEKCDDLMKQFMEECQLEAQKMNVDKDIQSRLDQMKEDRPETKKEKEMRLLMEALATDSDSDCKSSLSDENMDSEDSLDSEKDV